MFSRFFRRCVSVAHHVSLDDRNGGFRILNGFVDTASKAYAERYAEVAASSKKYLNVLKSAHAGGGSKGIKRHVEINKKILVRDRIKLLIDPGSDFLEIASIAGHDMPYDDVPAAGSVVGFGNVSGVSCIIMGNDATTKGGTSYPISVRKTLRMQEISRQLRLPAIYIVDSGGAFLPLQSEIFPDKEHGGKIFYNISTLGAEGIPQISVVCGSCTAGAAYIPTLSDDTIVVDKIGSLFLGGPPLVRAALGEMVTPEDLGGATVHCRTSGCADYFASDETTAFAICRDIVSTVRPPSGSNGHHSFPSPSTSSVSSPSSTPPFYHPAELNGINSHQPSGTAFVEAVLARLLDRSRFCEFRRMYGTSLVTGFGYITSHLVGIVASTGVPFDSKSALKASQFVQACDQRSIPLLFLTNGSSSGGDGWVLDDGDEYSDFGLKNVAQMMSSIACARTPKLVLHTGNSFGGENLAMCGRAFDPCFILAWPTARLGMQNPSRLDTEPCHGVEPQDIPGLQNRLREESSAIHAASRLWIDEIILPDQSRTYLNRILDIITQSRAEASSRAIVTRQEAVLRM